MNFCRHCGTSLAAPAPAPQRSREPTPVPGRSLDVQVCRACGGRTQVGFAFCQHCGTMLPTTPGGMRPPTAPPPAHNSHGPEAVAETLASKSNQPSPRPMGSRTPTPVPGQAGPTHDRLGSQPRPAAEPVTQPDAAWGTLYALRRDGSDGESYPLASDWLEIGRDGADLTFDDRYLALRHARLERRDGGARIVPVDQLNGVYRRIRAPHMLPSGTMFLIGRELLRYERVDDDERETAPLIRHGIAVFGSPARAPWGRVSHLLASGGCRDIRHLYASEVVIGREEGDIVFRDDEFLSRRHAALRWHNNQCTLADLDSSNGTFIRLLGPQPLENGDVLRMGDQMFRFELGAGRR